jgi:subtilisin family serine protease
MKMKKSLAITAVILALAGTTAQAQTLQSWMSPEVGAAWTQGYKGQGTTIMVVDDFYSTSTINGNLGDGALTQRHGDWTLKQASMVAPLANIASQNFNSVTAVPLAATGLNVLNLSYGMYASSFLKLSQITWSAQESSIINYAKAGSAVISKAAGNDAVAVGAKTKGGKIDFLNQALRGTQSAIYVGALSANGTTAKKASLASYSNFAGSDTTVQKQFLVVGVEGSKTNLYGTSFAAPIISGYAAVLGSKFTAATPTTITNQLLNTARTDTLVSFSAAKYGRGEASLTRALAPASIQ